MLLTKSLPLAWRPTWCPLLYLCHLW